MKIEIRKALPTDNMILSEIGRLTFYETWRPVNTEEDMQNYMNEAFNPDKLKKEIEDFAVNTFLIASAAEKIIGYAKLRRDRSYDEFKNETAIEIERIYVAKDWQGLKVGKVLMDKCLEIALNEKFYWIWLGVNIDNLKAINFYKQYGFEIFGEKSFQLGEANDSDYLMKRRM
jgi:ribosomal protein S18 acetylase RimI-like enzyme